jgi:hypothetical protein
MDLFFELQTHLQIATKKISIVTRRLGTNNDVNPTSETYIFR